jgi:hypothetical protein
MRLTSVTFWGGEPQENRQVLLCPWFHYSGLAPGCGFPVLGGRPL